MGLSVKKIYCQDCAKYRFRMNSDYCIIKVDDHFSKDHSVEANPKILNAKNDCPHFTEKEN